MVMHFVRKWSRRSKINKIKSIKQTNKHLKDRKRGRYKSPKFDSSPLETMVGRQTFLSSIGPFSGANNFKPKRLNNNTAPTKTNISPEKLCLEDDISFWYGTFFGDMLIFSGVRFSQFTTRCPYPPEDVLCCFCLGCHHLGDMEGCSSTSLPTHPGQNLPKTRPKDHDIKV